MSSAQTRVLLSLGSNLGNREENLYRAIALLVEREIVHSVVCSHLYETEPVGYTEQPQFLNMCIVATTKHTAEMLYTQCKEIEHLCGRIQRQQWHEREIDIDVCLFGTEIVITDVVQVPHKQMLNRAFVLTPAKEIAGDMVHPALNMRLEEIPTYDTSAVTKLPQAPFRF